MPHTARHLVPADVLEKIIDFARMTWRNDGAEGETVHKLCDELEHRMNEDAYRKVTERPTHYPSGLRIHEDIRLRGFTCRVCRVFTGEEHSIQTACRSCATPRPL